MAWVHITIAHMHVSAHEICGTKLTDHELLLCQILPLCLPHQLMFDIVN